MLQRPKHERDPMVPSPPADSLWGAPLGRQTPPGETVLARLIDADHRHLALGGTGGVKPHVPHTRLPRVLLPAPPLACDQVAAFALASIGQGKARGRFALYQQGTLMGIAPMLHELRVAQPP